MAHKIAARLDWCNRDCQWCPYGVGCRRRRRGAPSRGKGIEHEERELRPLWFRVVGPWKMNKSNVVFKILGSRTRLDSRANPIKGHLVRIMIPLDTMGFFYDGGRLLPTNTRETLSSSLLLRLLIKFVLNLQFVLLRLAERFIFAVCALLFIARVFFRNRRTKQICQRMEGFGGGRSPGK